MKYNQLRLQINKPYFTLDDLRLRGLKVYSYQFSLWQKRGYIKQLKRGTYVFADKEDELAPPEISFLLYQPSYLSLETALNHYGLIPEIVQAQTAVTAKINRRFKNSYGSFIYRHLKPSLFFGYTPAQTKYGKYLLAEPEKALLDYLYLNLGKINTQNDIENLRLNCQILREIITKGKLDRYLKIFDSRKLNRTINQLLRQCSPTNS
ncbi:MAG: hypothetical protein AAB360_00770 [Patescibacteria group bacterium]